MTQTLEGKAQSIILFMFRKVLWTSHKYIFAKVHISTDMVGDDIWKGEGPSKDLIKNKPYSLG